jgi:hypothetical protein
MDDTITRARGLESAVDIGFMDLTEARFHKTPGGFTGLKYRDKVYPRVTLRRALPLERPMEYISVADAENKEIGIIRSIDGLSSEQMTVVIDELDKRYYCPQVRAVKSVKDKLGYIYMELCLTAPGGEYERHCAVKDVNKNIRMLGDDRLLIFDVDGNRFIIPSLAALDKKSVKRLEPFLF